MGESIHGIEAGDIVRVTSVSYSKAIDQSDDNWSGNLELGRDEIIPQVREGVTFEVRRVRDSVRGSKRTLSLFPYECDIPSYKMVIASTYPSWPNGCSGGHKFDADGHTTHYSDKYFDLEVVE